MRVDPATRAAWDSEPTSTHVTTVHVLTNHRPGVDYAKWSCSCGAYDLRLHRPVSLAHELVDAHVRMSR